MTIYKFYYNDSEISLLEHISDFKAIKKTGDRYTHIIINGTEFYLIGGYYFSTMDFYYIIDLDFQSNSIHMIYLTQLVKAHLRSQKLNELI